MERVEMQNNIEFNHINCQVFQLLEDLTVAGETSNPRGFLTREANMCTLELNPYYPILDFEPRPINWRYFTGELAWYIKAEPQIKFINNFSSFWKTICPDGVANSNYGTLLFKDHPSSLIESEPGIRGVNQLEWAYNCLKKDKDSRQAVVFFNSPYFQYEGNKDFVCTMYVKFWISKNHLEMKVQMRSNDIFFGLTYDAPWFSTLHQNMHLELKKLYPELKLGVYYHCADNIHIYERHFELATQILDSQIPNSTKLVLNHPIFEFDENGNFQLSEKGVNYYNTVNDIVSNGKEIPSDQTFWKTILEDLYTITK